MPGREDAIFTLQVRQFSLEIDKDICASPLDHALAHFCDTQLTSSASLSLDNNQISSMQDQSPLTAERPLLLCVYRSSIHMSWLILLLLFLVFGREASGQGLASPMGTSSAPVLGGAGGARSPAQLPLMNGTQNATAKKHLTPTGKPCLTVQGYAKPQIVNSNIFEHVIAAGNECSLPIKIKICYYQSQECIPISVPAYGRKEVVLGIMPAMGQFQFEYREQFDQGTGGGLN